MSANDKVNSAAEVQQLVAALEAAGAPLAAMVTQVGNASNLILDPDLDSYWMMDAYVIKLPALGQLVAEAGVAGYEVAPWFAVFAPAGTPKPVVDKLNAEVQRVFRLPDVAERLKTLGLEAVLSSPEELAAYQASEITKWTKVVKESGARAE